MSFDQRRTGPYGKLSSSGAEPPGLLKKTAAVLVAAALFVVAMMFSVVLFAVVLAAGAAAWGYLWWKTRAARKRMNTEPYGGPRPDARPQQSSGGGLVIEGEVIREVRTPEDERR